MKLFRKSIRNKVIMALAASVLIPTLLLGLVYSNLMRRTLEDKVVPLAKSNFENLSLNFSQQLKNYLSLVTEAASSQAVVDIASKKYGDDNQKKQQAVNGCLSYLKTLDITDRIIYPYSMVIVCSDGTLITPNVYSSGDVYSELQEKILRSDYYHRAIETASNSSIITLRENLYQSNHDDQVYFIHNIIDRNRKACGIVMFCVEERFFASLLSNSNMAEMSSLYLTDENGELVIEGGNNKLSFSEVPIPNKGGRAVSETVTAIGKDGDRFIVMTKSLALPGINKTWNLSAVTNEMDLMGEMRSMSAIVTVLVAVMIIFGFLCTDYIRKAVLNPVIYYSNELQTIQDGHINTVLEAKGTDEIYDLGTDLVEMLGRIDTSVKELEKKEEEKRVLEARMLSAQINPHFIRNTLNSIRITAEMNQSYSVAEMIRVFARLIDYVFKRNAFSTVRAELAYLDDYITLQNLRYQDKFIFEKDVDDELLDCSVMSSIFQPIVENSIVHGFSGKKGTGTIRMTGRICGSMAEYTIEDDGNGIMFTGEISTKDSSPHGLTNVQRRIELGYGPEYGLKIDGRETGGTVVVIRLPLGNEGERL